MQHNTTAQKARIIPTDAESVAEAIIRLNFWHDALLNVRAERREIIHNETISYTMRKQMLINNAGVTACIRARLSECQHEHMEAVERAAQRIASSVSGLIEHSSTPSANTGAYDAYEGTGVSE